MQMKRGVVGGYLAVSTSFREFGRFAIFSVSMITARGAECGSHGFN